LRPFLVPVLCLALPTVALAADPAPPPTDPATDGTRLDSGEFRNTADTTEKGAFIFHPLLRSSYGISDHVDVKVPILGFLLGGPRGSFEAQLVDSDAVKVSIEPEVAASWNFRNYGATGNLRLTFMLGENRFNLSAGAGYGRTYIKDTDPTTDGDQTSDVTGLGLPVNVGFDLVSSDATTIRFVANTNVYTLTAGVFAATVGANWNHAFGDTFRLSLGVVLLVGVIPGYYQALEDAGLPPIPPVLPFPTFELWWRF
jgi:hypothetical protein